MLQEKKYQLGVMRARLASSLPPLTSSTTMKHRTSTTTVLRPPTYHLQTRYDMLRSSVIILTPFRRSGPLPPLTKPSGTSIDKNFNRVQFIPKSKRAISDQPIRVSLSGILSSSHYYNYSIPSSTLIF